MLKILQEIGIPKKDYNKHFKGKKVTIKQRGKTIYIYAGKKQYFTKPSWDFYTERLSPPSRYDKGSFRKKIIKDRQLLLACPIGKWDANTGKCNVGTKAVSIARTKNIMRRISDKYGNLEGVKNTIRIRPVKNRWYESWHVFKDGKKVGWIQDRHIYFDVFNAKYGDTPKSKSKHKSLKSAVESFR